jgi:hypothetical protein
MAVLGGRLRRFGLPLMKGKLIGHDDNEEQKTFSADIPTEGAFNRQRIILLLPVRVKTAQDRALVAEAHALVACQASGDFVLSFLAPAS